MYKRMLVPLDGSRLSEVVCEYAQALANRLGMDLVLLHVCSPEEMDLFPLHKAYINKITESLTLECAETHQRAGNRPNKKPGARQGEIICGRPAEEILHYASTHDIDLIIMATHGRTGIGTGALGSVTSHVISASEVPVWLVPSCIAGEIVYDEWPTNKILVPLDGSGLAECVLPHVENLVAQRDSGGVEVILLKVCQATNIPPYYMDAMMPYKSKENVWQDLIEQENESLQYLARIEKRLKKAGITVNTQVLTGKPANEILDFANSTPLNLIIMSTHGESGVVQWAYGSVVDKVLHEVASPVFLVRPEEACDRNILNLTATGGRSSHV